MDIKDTTLEKNIKDNALGFVLLKLSKLASAAYMITAYIEDKDPVKWKIREKCLSLMSDIEVLNEQKVIGHIERMVHLLDVVLVNDLASRMNFSLLKQEYLALQSQLAKNQLTSAPLSEKRRPSRSNLGAAPIGPTNQREAKRASSRQEAILQGLKTRGGWLSIKEVNEIMPEWSAKIIQRELQSLVLNGKVRRVGEKRWSRYSVD